MSDKRFIPPFSSPGEFHAIEEEKIGRERKQKKQSKNTPHTLVFSKKIRREKLLLHSQKHHHHHLKSTFTQHLSSFF
jgi:hypothetical protein